MQFVFLAGGFAGFALTTVTGLLSGREPDLVLRDGAIGCLAGALLFRWFWGILIRGVSDAVTAKRAAEEAAAAAAAESTQGKQK